MRTGRVVGNPVDWFQQHPYKSVIAAILGVLVGVVGFLAFQSVRAFNAAASDPFAPDVAQSRLDSLTPEQRRALALAVSEDRRRQLTHAYAAQVTALEAEQQALREAQNVAKPTPFENPYVVSPPLPDGMFESILLVGADASGYLADTIIDVLLPADGSAPIMVSIPRDLYVLNPCTQTYERVNAMLGGCKGYASGPELLALAIKEFTGIKVDHYARVSFLGFARIVDAMGGYQICVDYPTRDPKSGLDIQAPGCFVADGETTLAWVRSRHTQQYIDGTWKTVGFSDFDRQRRQQDFLFAMAARMKTFGSAAGLIGTLGDAASFLRMDSGWSVTSAASLAWKYRSVGPGDVIRLNMPLKDYVTPSGAWVLIPKESFNADLAAVYPAAKR